MTLKLASNLQLPIDAAVQKFAFLARSGAGKSYGAGVLVEELYRTTQQVVIVDPIGTWWGLRSAADGKGPGLPILVFGGTSGDIPLEPTAGELVAGLVAEKGLSVVLDVSDFTGADQRRFVTAFATTLHHLKKRHRSPVMVVWEECQDFVPQRVGPREAAMVGAMERLIKQGRNFGIGTTLISQRPQAVNKDVLNQTEILFVLQLTGPQERKAIETWILDKGLDRSPLDELPKLPIGDAFVWSPQWLGIFRRIHFGKKRTFDASATPTFGKRVHARELAPVDLDKVRTEMAATIQRAEASDPTLLRKRVADLEAQLRRVKAPLAAKVERVEVSVLTDATITRLEASAARWEKQAEALRATIRQAMAGREERARVGPPTLGPPPARRFVSVVPPPIPIQWGVPHPSGDMPPGECATLEALIQYGNGLQRKQLRVLTGYKRSSSDAYISRLVLKGLVAVQGDTIRATDVGRAALPNAKPLPSGEALREFWMARLPEGERKILGHLIDAYPHPAIRESLEVTGYRRSSRDAYLSRLAARELVEVVDRGNVRASPTLFEVTP